MPVQIRPATQDDHGSIFTLQRAAFVDEARLYNTPFVPALDETFAELVTRMEQSTSWVAELNGRVVGAVSLRTYRNEIPDIERLMVAPDQRGGGISRHLLQAAETHASGAGHAELQLVVGDLATANRAIYQHLGWVQHSTMTLEGFDHVVLHTMTKQLS